MSVDSLSSVRQTRRLFWLIGIIWTIGSAALFGHELIPGTPHDGAEGSRGVWLAVEITSHLMLWLLGIGGVFFAAIHNESLIQERLAEAARRKQSEEQFRLLVESTDEVVIMQDREGRFLYYNPGRTYGVTAEDIVGHMPSDLFDPATSARMQDRLNELITTRRPTEYEEDIIWKDETLWFHVKRFPVRDANGAIHAVSTFARNITEQKRTQMRLQETEESLKLERLRVQIAADLHDDIGSTLSSTSIFASMLRRNLSAHDPKTTPMLNRIEENLVEAQEALHEIVWAINPGNDNFENILVRVQEYAVSVLEGKGIDFHVMVPDDTQTPKIPMHMRRDIYLILKEAITNAALHSDCTVVSLSALIEGSFLTVRVGDNGIGLDRKAVSRGNGLRNMESRAAAIGGSLDISGQKRNGTTVSLSAPIT